MNSMNSHNQKMVFGFDFDGVVIDHTALKIESARRVGYDITPAQTQSDIIKKIIPRGVLEKVEFDTYANPKTALTSPLVKEVESFLEWLAKEHIPFYLISRRRKGASRQMALELMKLHNITPEYFNQDNIFFVKNGGDKNVAAKNLGVTHYIDDEIKILRALESVSTKFLMDPYKNFHSEYKKEFNVVSGWDEVVRALM